LLTRSFAIVGIGALGVAAVAVVALGLLWRPGRPR
jgi:hypothetical protein